MNQSYIEPYIITYTRRKLNLLDPQRDQISIVDIAHHLSKLCRYNGATEPLYTVAQHSVLVSQHCSQSHALWGLLHDAHEAYTNDVSTPVKHICDDYKHVCSTIQNAITRKYCSESIDELALQVSKIDDRIQKTEMYQLCDGDEWDEILPNVEPYYIVIDVWSPRQAKDAFLNRFVELTNQVQEFES